MTEIKWIGTGANTSFHTSSNWQGGMVPGMEDTAVFDASAPGNCILNEPVTLFSLKVLPSYQGAFNANGKKITINGGVLWLLKGTTAVITVNGEIDFTGTEAAFYSVELKNLRDIKIRGGTDCTWWWNPVSGSLSNVFRDILQEQGSTLRLNSGMFYDTGLNFSSYYSFESVGKQDWHGKIISTAGKTSSGSRFAGEVVFHKTGEFDVSARSLFWFTSNSTGCVTAEAGCRVHGEISLAARYNGVMVLNPCDFRSFKVEVDILSGNRHSKR